MKNRTSAVLAFWIVAAAIIAGIAVIAFASQRIIIRNTADAFNRQQLFLVREAARGIEQSIANIRTSLHTAADMYTRTGKESVLEVLFNHRQDMLQAVFLVDREANLLFGYPDDVSVAPTWLRSLKPSIAQAASSNADAFMTDSMSITIGSQKSLSFVVGVPLRGTAQWLCCIPDFGAIKKEFIYPIQTGTSGYAWMIDSKGMLLAHPNPSMEGRKALDVLKDLWPGSTDYTLEVIINREMTRGEEGKGEYTGWHVGQKKPVKKLVSYSPIHFRSMLWSIGVSAPYREAMAPLMRGIAGPVVFLACFIITIIAGAWLLSVQAKRKIHASQELSWRQEVFDGITDGISIIDKDYRVLMVNKAVSKWQGKPQDFFKGKRCFEVFQQENDLCLGCPAKEAFVTGQPVFRERVSTTLAGKKYYFHLSAFPLKDQEGNTVRVAECVKDVTGEMQLRQELLQHERKSVIVKMAAQVAHEIRNPLGTLTLNIDLLEDEIDGYSGVESGEAKSLLTKIKSEIESLHRVLQEYLECTRFPTIRPEQHDIDNIIEGLFSLLEEDLRRKKIVFKTSFEYDLPMARVDQDQIRRAFLNIIQNAMEAMGTGGTIDVITRTEGPWIVIDFSDSGPGMPPEQVDKIFTPFFTTKSGGTGLGLSITQHIVTEHKGEITCESRAGQGTRFSVKLPRWEEETPPAKEE